jgi:predicted RND superfamily exporter protein
MLGAFFILDDPIFNGLAISLIFGILVSTVLTLVVIPLLYYGFAKVDTDASPQASRAHGIRSIPTLVLFQGGQELARRSGATSAGDLVQWVQARLADPANPRRAP